VPAAAAAVLLIALFMSQQTTSPTVDQAVSIPNKAPQDQIIGIPPVVLPEVATTAKTKISQKRLARFASIKTRFSAPKRSVVPSPRTVAAKEEIKSEFITLSYARDPESGQIVRVKVPRSMMVTVGLVASVDKPTTLVDAEVLLGDDGLTRAIRFIR
jgi:hypothetical protein